MTWNDRCNHAAFFLHGVGLPELRRRIKKNKPADRPEDCGLWEKSGKRRAGIRAPADVEGIRTYIKPGDVPP